VPWVDLLIKFGVSAALSWLLVAGVRRLALSQAVLDHPNERSSHEGAIPRGGGAGLVAAFVVVFTVAASLEWRTWLGLALAGAIPTALAGIIDDWRGLPVLPRLIAHVASGLFALPLVLSTTGGTPGEQIGITLVWLLAMATAINVTNFMDGIDGLVGVQAVVFGVHLSLLGAYGGSASTFGVALAGASCGFLAWNWPPASIFLGDVGSGTLGLLSLIGGWLVVQEGNWSILLVYLPLFPFLLDASVTLALRAVRGQSLVQAHRTHLYQRLANGGWGHGRVTVLYGLGALLPVGLVALTPHVWLTGAALLYCFVVGIVAWRLGLNSSAMAA
jgi:UDP-N-acetylmuramyl pentapeptide phosphotransferase/UDP-N-acetylglucosamine-1-phosphate transferase